MLNLLSNSNTYLRFQEFVHATLILLMIWFQGHQNVKNIDRGTDPYLGVGGGPNLPSDFYI